MRIGGLTCIPAALLPHSLCRCATVNAPANRQMPIASVVGHNGKKRATMITMRKFVIVIIWGFIIFPTICKGQYVSHYIEKDRIKIDTLIDKTTGVRFILDKKRIYIKAIDKSGKVLWKTDPAVDNNLDEYRVKRPTIVYFAFKTDKFTDNKEVIAISYNNSQFGYLDKKTGHFQFEGQD